MFIIFKPANLISVWGDVSAMRSAYGFCTVQRTTTVLLCWFWQPLCNKSSRILCLNNIDQSSMCICLLGSEKKTHLTALLEECTALRSHAVWTSICSKRRLLENLCSCMLHVVLQFTDSASWSFNFVLFWVILSFQHCPFYTSPDDKVCRSHPSISHNCKI